ncbi:MAG: hypothetical protein A2898_03085 [Candidatus Kerfeldbacteria bacterium RIFCSPLOWO2_01_FULL_48_11]|uniref:THIF-type NAD/FAD binding fold domain-containing protein n=1 Tax=Candidatus Kerfeldbacteria bacterium RIFCSPLOWO2_01_FULL_48_11 TaxID=1798543 RepID=A0A1G2B7T9_9BACT|nr:MAG: UBA/THIF-type NAD/FAD binding protein [Parcubacteria group bacterium GW2011_GWA2_48_9]KKW13442.1 MAG: UBA/THIF-type NAD/FAD binding protein [Parcubacteria group bacterium GW2011_GWC2_49_9]OGY84287.1 MAG: hypothetical protein A2898_03085 [Candidatus Kerfeldbacteria bacterium RIFCSPLOWO2_01_FULL_48_11]HCJ52959.1 hypothetical protein [Candidatus Kerfeldbacteria bacterium]HCM68017.1 hypothetical protein [Candidatus Kerfeldbacteria bacterium]
MDYFEMFDRNIGVITMEEQRLLRKIKVGIVGCGGMGSTSGQILARTGIESFTVADQDTFQSVNINNQFTAFKSTLGQNKAVVLAKFIQDINPAASVKVYSEGLQDGNVDEFVGNVDIVFDCVDYNELYYSYILNKKTREYNKYMLTPQAVGYGGSVLVYDPKGISLNEYLGLQEGLTKKQIDKFTIPPEKYSPIIPSYVDSETIERTVMKQIPIPNIALAQTLIASIMVSEALFILLKKREPVTVPSVIAVDCLEKKFVMR